MQLSLQPPVSTYFEASNAHDADALAALFVEGPEARVHDERQDHRGREAIRGRAEETFRQYQMLQTPRAVREESRATVVTTGVSGTFPGSPIELDFHFVLDGRPDQGIEDRLKRPSAAPPTRSVAEAARREREIPTSLTRQRTGLTSRDLLP